MYWGFCMCLNLKVVFEVGFNSQTGGHIALDDISFSPVFCSSDTGEHPNLHTVSSMLFSSSCYCFLCRADLWPFHRQLWLWVGSLPLHTRVRVIVEGGVREAQRLQEWRPHHGGRYESAGSWWKHTDETFTCSKGGRGFHPYKSRPLLPGSFLLAHSRFGPRSTYVSRVLGPTLAGNMKYCLRFFFSLRGEARPWILIFVFIAWWDPQSRLIVNVFVLCRLQPDGPGFSCLSAAAQRGPGTDLDSGGEVQRDLDRSRRQLPDVKVCQGEWGLMESHLNKDQLSYRGHGDRMCQNGNKWEFQLEFITSEQKHQSLAFLFLFPETWQEAKKSFRNPTWI